MVLGRTTYYILSVPMVFVTLLYTSIVRRMFYLVPSAILSLFSEKQGGGIIVRVLIVFAISTFALHGFLSLPIDIYMSHAGTIERAWNAGLDSLTEQAVTGTNPFAYGARNLVIGVWIPKLHVFWGMVLTLVSFALSWLIDRVIRSIED
ncbi:hypothetical protein [Vibrio sp. Hal054]|uniref:hypothetical protein n=1 Tax=Vibrio sp. Hal054 TaxID=3035158 RepID=UPI00301C3211